MKDIKSKVGRKTRASSMARTRELTQVFTHLHVPLLTIGCEASPEDLR